MRLVQYFALCTMITFAATNPDVEDKLTEMNADLPENKQVSFHVAIEIPARYAECFYQYVGERAKLYVDFKVLRGYGTDQNIVMKMFDPNEEEIAERIGNSGEEERDLGERDNLSLGTYRICFYNLDNLFSRLVDLNVRVNSVDWFEYKEHLPEDTLEDLDKSRIVESLDRLLGSLDHVKLQATRSRLSLTVDSLRAEASVSYVDHMALLSCLLIIGSGLMQVYFVRKLFETPNVRGTTNKA